MTGIGCELDGMDVDAPFALLFYCKLFNASNYFIKRVEVIISIKYHYPS